MPARRKPDDPTEETIDDAIELSFPASDPPAYGSPTGTEPPTQPTDRRSPLPSRSEIDAAADRDDDKP
ncbi:MAG: hypothetical protein AB7K67_10515 [Hyphomicrobiaceae bacterium]